MKQLMKAIIKQKTQALININLPKKESSVLTVYYYKKNSMINLQTHKYIIICALNKTSILGLILIVYNNVFKQKTQPNIYLTTPSTIHNLFITSHQLVYAQYCSFFPYIVKNHIVRKQIDFIGQRWFARFSNCFILIYKKNL
jgi:hypothetical protein